MGLVILVSGCTQGPTPSSLAGNYKAEMKLSPDGTGNLIEGLANALVKQVGLEIRADGVFVLSLLIPIEGKYIVNGRVIQFTMPGSDKPTLGKVSTDQQTIEFLSHDPNQGTLLFKRQAN